MAAVVALFGVQLRVRRLPPALIVLIYAFCSGLMLAPAASAQSAKDFSCSYQFTDVSQSGDRVSLTLNLRLVNHSGADLTNGTILLVDSQFPRKTYNQFLSISVLAGQSVVLSNQVSVSPREYQLWLQGHAPSLVLEYTSFAGAAVYQPLSCTRQPVGGN